MKTAYVIGAGQLGSRHAQALKAVQGLRIRVIDPSPDALALAEERFAAAPGKDEKQASFHRSLPPAEKVDLAIIATTARHRRQAIETLLEAHEVRFLVLEKILFPKREDYAAVGELLKRKQVRSWVNCPMRMIPCYAGLKERLGGGPVFYQVSGSRFGLATSAIHYLDHLAYLTRNRSFTLDTSDLEPELLESKRHGYQELAGTLRIRGADGSIAVLSSHRAGDKPLIVSIESQGFRYIGRETEGLAWTSTAPSWEWREEEAPITYQSRLTTLLAEALFSTGDCQLTPYEESAALHLLLHDAFMRFLKNAPQLPFT